MPTAVIDLDLKNRAPGLRVDARFTQALVLLRWGRRPVGRLMLPLAGGAIDAASLERALAGWAGSTFWLTWLRDSLGWDEAESTRPLPPATVAVCTRERPDDLLRCLGAVCALPDQGQDVLVVDNRPAT
ncbi:MAG TPA: hypothetical protein VK911_11700, partial [Vicinamibacterales bacterium]|nr:hypothetical protein [Vicinamibacterales bacterium]